MTYDGNLHVNPYPTHPPKVSIFVKFRKNQHKFVYAETPWSILYNMLFVW